MIKDYPCEKEFVDLLVSFVNTREREVIKALDDYHRGRVGVKSFGENSLFSALVGIFALEHLKPKIRAIIGRMVSSAVLSAEKDLNVNIVDFNPGFGDIVFEKSFRSISDWTDELGAALGESMLKGWRAGEGIPELRERVKEVYGDGRLTDARAEMIARTETVYVFNASRIQAAKDSGVGVMKNWNAYFDSRTGKDSVVLHKRYFKHPIPLDDFFVDEVNGKEVFQAPNRPNCRCRNDLIPV